MGTAADQGAHTRELTVEQLLDFLGRMIEIRLFEDEIQRLFNQNLVRGSTHLCSGQEAVAVGACSALRKSDAMLCTYRGHGAVLAMGAPLDRTFGEILGKPQGLCAGKGGSMHLTDVSVGAYGSFAIVGAHLPIATGFGFAAKYTEADDVCSGLFRRRHGEHRRLPRGHEPRGGLEAAGDLPVREQPLRRVLAGGADDADRGARPSRGELRDARCAHRRQRRARGLPGSRGGRRARARWQRPDADRGDDLPPQGPLAHRPRHLPAQAGGRGVARAGPDPRARARAGGRRGTRRTGRGGAASRPPPRSRSTGTAPSTGRVPIRPRASNTSTHDHRHLQGGDPAGHR